MGPYGLALGWARAEMDEKKPNVYSVSRPDYAFYLGRNGLRGRDQTSGHAMQGESGEILE